METALTITVDDQVAALLRRESERRGSSVEAAASELLKSLLPDDQPRVPTGKPGPFVVRATHMGPLPHRDYTKTAELLEYGEGPFHR